MAYTFPDEWHSLHRTINFSLSSPYVSGQVGVETTLDTLAIRVPSPLADIAGSKLIWVDSDPRYKGLHTVKAITDEGSYRLIVTNTPYVGSPTFMADISHMWPFKVRLHAGYPSIVATDIVVNVFWNKDGLAVVNVAPFIRELFSITGPSGPPDTGLFTHVQIEVLPSTVWQTYLDDNTETVESTTGYDMADHTLWVVNGSLPHDDLQILASANAILTNAPTPIINEVVNVFSIIRSTGTIDTVISITI